MTDLSPLITALEKAEGPSRELDFAIHEFLCPATPSIISGAQPSPGFGRDAISMQMDPRPHYTSSTDTAIALTERLLTGWQYAMQKSDHGYSAVFVPSGESYVGDELAYQDAHVGPNLPIALISAAFDRLAALKAKEAGDA